MSFQKKKQVCTAATPQQLFLHSRRFYASSCERKKLASGQGEFPTRPVFSVHVFISNHPIYYPRITFALRPSCNTDLGSHSGPSFPPPNYVYTGRAFVFIARRIKHFLRILSPTRVELCLPTRVADMRGSMVLRSNEPRPRIGSRNDYARPRYLPSPQPLSPSLQNRGVREGPRKYILLRVADGRARRKLGDLVRLR